MFTYKPLNSAQGDNSYLYLLKFNAPAQANDRVYLTMDSAIDQARIVGIETHVHIPFANYDFPATINLDGITYNVITFVELNAMTLTLVNKKRSQILSQYPFNGLLNQFAIPFTTKPTKTFRKFDLDVLTGESFVQFNVGSVIASPFVAPITFYFDEK
jgi:hypothetical protein